MIDPIAASGATLPLRLLVVDDHRLFRRGLVGLLRQDRRFSVAGEAADAVEAQTRAAALDPDVILLDNHLPGVRGIDAIAGLREAAPRARILMLTVSEDEPDLAAALRAGADGYLLKTIDVEALAESILKVVDGDAVVSPEMLGKLVGILRSTPAQAPAPDAVEPAPVTGAPGSGPGPASGAEAAFGPDPRTLAGAPAPDSPSADDPIHTLSPREREILALIARGDSNKQLGRTLDLAETTEKIHVQRILRKLSLPNRVHAAVYATERGVV